MSGHPGSPHISLPSSLRQNKLTNQRQQPRPLVSTVSTSRMIIDLMPQSHTFKPRKQKRLMNTCMRAIANFDGVRLKSEPECDEYVSREKVSPKADRNPLCENFLNTTPKFSPKKPFQRSCNEQQIQRLASDILILPPPQLTNTCKRRLHLTTEQPLETCSTVLHRDRSSDSKRRRCDNEITIAFDLIERNQFSSVCFPHAPPCTQSFILTIDRKVLGCLLSFLGLRELTLLDACCSKSMRDDDEVDSALDTAWDTIAAFYFIFK